MRTMFIVSLLSAAPAIALAAPTEQYEAPQIPLEVTAYTSASCSPNTDVASISLIWDAVSRIRHSMPAEHARCAKFDHDLPDGCTLILTTSVSRSIQSRHNGPISAGTPIRPRTRGEFKEMIIRCKPVRIGLFYFRGITVDVIHDSNVVHPSAFSPHYALGQSLRRRFEIKFGVLYVNRSSWFIVYGIVTIHSLCKLGTIFQKMKFRWVGIFVLSIPVGAQEITNSTHL
ncbi:hypothetical protein EV359DRAFT_62137 [Lentinula novae-zelandiae]|nr:hypothetical protein EV359DRAFT_62137 [Lentinula novae-zelandiae]